MVLMVPLFCSLGAILWCASNIPVKDLQRLKVMNCIILTVVDKLGLFFQERIYKAHHEVEVIQCKHLKNTNGWPDRMSFKSKDSLLSPSAGNREDLKCCKLRMGKQ